MNYINPEKIAKLIKAAKRLSGFCVLIFGISLFFYSLQTHSVALPDCSGVAGTPKPGYADTANGGCEFFGMPLCQTVPSATYTVSSDYVLTSGQVHRYNCADLSDLPLCSDIDSGHTANPGKNCVKECSDASFTNPDPSHEPANVRGVDYAVHNRDCIRFRDAPESGVTATTSNSIGRRCHQTTSPSPTVNCDSLSCNLLTPDELNDPKFKTEADAALASSTYIPKQYCNGSTASDGTTLKCYKFTQAQLPYTILNTTCKIHDCPPSSSACGDDDTLNITNQGTSYVTDYKKYVNANYDLGTGICNTVTCKPVVKRQYRCTPTNATTPTVRNTSCDTTGAGATCANSYCYLTIDCNQTSNNSQPECITSTPSEDGTIGSTSDTMNSWFYRPQPMSKAISSAGILRNMSSSLCYSKSQMDSFGWGAHPSINFGLLGTLDLGYYHSYLLPDQTRSPGLCDGIKDGSRGNGYIYLCGNGGNLYSNISDYTAYHKGYVVTTFEENSGVHKLIVCLRFKNAMRPDDGTSETCGARECGISCAFDDCSNQVCGYDVCHELTVTDSNPTQCMMDDDMFKNPNNDTRNCTEIIDDYLRIRAVKYPGNRICTFLDVKGQTAYSDSNPLNFLGASEKLSDGTCISGLLQSDGSCSDGKSSFDDKSKATRWRAIKLGGSNHIPYIQNNRPSGSTVRGYLDKNLQLFLEQECIKTPLRISTPRLFNLANVTNSSKLFTPPLYILTSSVVYGGSISSVANQEYGPTDFHYPEITLQFGATTKKLSLGLGYTGYEATGGDANGSATITTTVNNVTYSLDVFVRKEYDDAGSKPIFCLYRTVKDINGNLLNPMRIGCVDRILPEINNTTTLPLPATGPKKMVVYIDPASTYSSSSIVIRYLGGFGANGLDNTCTVDDACTAEIKLSNSNVSIPTCSSTTESYNLCVQREECSQLNNECITNEVTMQTEKNAGRSVDSYLAVRENCNEILLPLCNKKKGNTTSDTSTVTNTNLSAAATGNYYGWFNEICVSSGFTTKLRQIVAYRMTDGTRGKCLVANPSSCPEGGKAPNCNCIAYVDGDSLPDTQVARTETPHEAGLCVTMPVPQICTAIDYNTTANTSNPSDSDFTQSSLGYSTYGASTSVINNVVHISHQLRTAGTGHAEFPIGVFGMYDIEGTCTGFWRAATNSAGVVTPPKRSCLNVSGAAQWDATVTNPCVRYTCDAVSTTGPDVNGLYQGGYGASEVNETTYQSPSALTGTKGYEHGFATWTSYTKTNDFLETPSSPDAFVACITGFKKQGSVSTTTGTNVATTVPGGPFFGPIQGYTGGVKATRTCNQIGQWGTVTNACARIQCSAVTPPSNPSSTSDWQQWNSSGGATFPAINASRSTLRIQTESVATGSCGGGNSALGFFRVNQTSSDPNSGINPTRNCDHMGNWGPVINPCTTQCDATTTTSSGSGMAYWKKVTGVPLNGQVDGEIKTVSGNNGCETGYYPYPYTALNSKDGTPFTISSSGPYRTDSGTNSTLTKIPDKLVNDTRAVEAYPQRVCRSVTIANGTASVWSTTSSSCINKCVGYSVNADTGVGTGDSRIGAGRTQHLTSANDGTNNGVTITVNWPDKNFGDTAYIINPILTNQNAAHYQRDRLGASSGVGYYALARKCNETTHKWDDVIPQCVANNGMIVDDNNTQSASDDIDSNADYDTTNHYVPINTSPTTKSCKSGYMESDYIDSTNKSAITNYTCSYASNGLNYIDQLYFDAVANSGKACIKYCNTGSISATGNSYTGTTYIATGTTVTLSCASGYGKAVDGGTSGSYDNSCGRNAYDRTDVSPTITCNSSGSWDAVSNSCSVCRGCTSTDSDATGTTYCRATNNDRNDCYGLAGDYMSGHCDNQHRITFTPSNLSHNATKDWCQHQDHDNGTEGNFVVTCVDNEYQVIGQCGCDNNWGNNNSWANSGCPSITTSSECTQSLYSILILFL